MSKPIAGGTCFTIVVGMGFRRGGLYSFVALVVEDTASGFGGTSYASS